MPPPGWLEKQAVAKQAEHCARATPECFEDDPGVIRIFLNGKRTFGGVEKLHPATLVWGDKVQQPINACVDAIPPRLTDEDIGITQEQWAGCAPQAQKRTATKARAVRAAAGSAVACACVSRPLRRDSAASSPS